MKLCSRWRTALSVFMSTESCFFSSSCFLFKVPFALSQLAGGPSDSVGLVGADNLNIIAGDIRFLKSSEAILPEVLYPWIHPAQSGSGERVNLAYTLLNNGSL
jgi:hypothetical protein